MAVIGSLIVLMGVNNAQLTAGLAKSEAELKGFGATAGVTSAKVGALMGGIGVVALAGLGLAAKSAAGFESEMKLIQTQAGASAEEVAAMSPKVLALASALGTSPDELARGLFHIESASYRGADALDVLTVAAKGAKIGHSDLEATTNALLATVRSGIPGINSAGEAMGGLNAIVGAGNMRMEDLNSAIGTGIFATVKGFGVTFADVGAGLALFGDNALVGSEAASKFRMSAQALGTGMAGANKALAPFGITTEQLRDDLETGGMGKALAHLNQQFIAAGVGPERLGPILAQAFGRDAAVGLSILLGQFDKLQTKYTAVETGTQGLDAAWAATLETAAFRWDRIGASIEAIGISMGTTLLPVVNELLDRIGPIVQGFGDWANANPGLATTIGQVALALLTLSIGMRLVALLGAPVRLAMAVMGVASGAALTGGVVSGIGLGVPLIVAAILLAAIPIGEAFKSWLPPELKGPGGKGESESQRRIGEGRAQMDQNAWGTFNTPGFRAGEVGSPYAGPMIPTAAAFGGRSPDERSTTINLVVDGDKLATIVERRLYNDASTWSSGFTTGPTPIR